MGATVGIAIVVAGALLFSLMVTGLIMTRLYTRASKEVSFVRTGWGGQRVIMNGGALVFPVLHETIPVNMNTLRLMVTRVNEQALITRDRMRVDVTAEFYVRVKPTEDAIADAAQTLGKRTMAPEALKDLVEGKFVDSLRSVAAEMTMEELHEQRVDFVQKVQKAVTEDLLKNGMELETVSLTGLDQTSKDYFNPDNAFDARGLTKLTEEIQARKKQRNDIEQDTEVQIRLKNLEAEKKKLELEREEEYAKLEQQREIEVRKAGQAAEIAAQRADRERESKEAEITAKQKVEEKQIESQKQIKEQEIAREEALKAREIQKNRAVEANEIEKQKVLQLAEQDRSIAIAQKSREKSEAEAEASKAMAQAVSESEKIESARALEIANRQKEIELVEAARKAEKEAISVKVAAEADKRAALDQAEAIKTLAEAEAEKVKIAAKGEAEARILKAQSEAKTYEVEARGKAEVNKSMNLLSQAQVDLQFRLALLQHLPAIIEQSVKPMEKIDDIKIWQLDGLMGGSGMAGQQEGDQSLPSQMVNSALKYRVQAPLVDSLLKELGLNLKNFDSLNEALELVNTASIQSEVVAPVSGEEA